MRQTTRIGIGIGLFVAAMGIPATAAADDYTSTHDKAAAAFVEARKLIDSGNCEAAVGKLRESLSYESSIGARLSIVDCIEQRDAVNAWRTLKDASVLALMNHDDRLAVLEQRAAVLQSRLAMITFKLPAASEQPGFELRLDGELVDRYLYRSGVGVAAGRHIVEASSNGRRFTGIVNTEIGQSFPVDIVLQGEDCRKATITTAGLTTASSNSVYDRGATRRALGLSLGGLGIASIASGVVFGILTLDKKSTLQGQCGGNVGTCGAPNRSLDSETEAAKTTAAISTVSFIVGGAALLGGAAIYLTAPSPVRVAPSVGKNGGGGTLEASW
jgi:hypothetical protein